MKLPKKYILHLFEPPQKKKKNCDQEASTKPFVTNKTFTKPVLTGETFTEPLVTNYKPSPHLPWCLGIIREAGVRKPGRR